jgi:Uma2 family endonuclease
MEYWVLDVPGRRVIVHRQPQAGKYSTILTYSEQESVAPLAAPQAMFPVSSAFAE